MLINYLAQKVDVLFHFPTRSHLGQNLWQDCVHNGIYIKIPLIQLAQNWAGAELPYIADCQMVPLLAYVFTGDFLLLLV